MKKMLMVVMLVVCSAVVNAADEVLTPALIEEAIREGMAIPTTTKPKSFDYQIKASIAPVDEVATFSLGTPYSRIVDAASSAKRKYLPFTSADVTARMLDPVIHVSAYMGSYATHIVVATSSAENAEIIQPLKTETVTLFSGMGIRGFEATFPVSVLKAGYEFRVITDGGPWIYPLTAAQVAQIR